MEDNKPWGIEVNAFCLLFHLSQFTSIIIPLAGIILPVVMWATNKDEFPIVDAHARNLFNWSLSLLLYLIISIPLIFIVIGVISIYTLCVLNIVFVIMAAVKANKGVLWKYPLSINFVKQKSPA